MITVDKLFIYADNQENTMSDVTGSIGNEYVELNNAATEATLKLLLQATLTANKQSLDNIKNLAQKSGLDPKAVAAMNTNVKQSTGIFSKLATAGTETANKIRALDDNISPLIKNLSEGTATVGDVFSAFEQLPGILGVVATAFRRLAEFQDQNMKMYQQISDAGAGFGGNLIKLRQSALSTYMTLDEFANLIKNNSEALAKMGSDTDEGARAFVRLSNSLLKSKVGDELLALGYTTEQVNQGMANYIAMTGGRTRKEMQNTDGITKGAKEYLTQLDALAVITGKSREEQEKQLKEAQANAAYEAYMQTLDEEGKKKATLAMQNALATGGKAGADLLKSQLLGLPPMTEAAQKLQALGPNVANGIKQMGDAVTDTRKTTKDVNKGYAAAQAGATQDMQKFGKTAAALSFGTDSTSQALMGMQAQANRNTAQGIKNQEDAERQLAGAAAKQKEREESQARAAAESQKAMKEFGQAVMNVLGPIVSLLTPAINYLAKGVSSAAKLFDQLPGVLQATIAAFIAYRIFLARQASSGGGGGPSVPTPSPGGPSPKGRGMGKALGRLSIGGLLGGFALDAAAEKMAEAGNTKTAAALDIGSYAASGAGLGAMLGAPALGIGAVPAAAIGGVLGAGYGAFQHFFGGPKMANGGVVTKPTIGMVGEKEPEIVSPLRHIESLQTELQTLNKQSAEMLKYLKETAEYTRRTVDATKSLGGDLFRI